MGLIQVAVPTVASSEFLTSCVSSVLGQEDVVDFDVLIVCNSERVLEESQMWQARGLRVVYSLRNLGTSASWNLSCRSAWKNEYEACLLLNDDVQLQSADFVRRLRAAVREDPRRLLFGKGLGFSAIAITRQVWDEAGEFDEGFWPAYFEDNDYHRRAALMGIGSSEVDLSYVHFGSGSLRKWKEWEDWNARWAFPLNAKRFYEKWGGIPETASYQQPWDGHPERAWSTREWLRSHEPTMTQFPPPWGWE